MIPSISSQLKRYKLRLGHISPITASLEHSDRRHKQRVQATDSLMRLSDTFLTANSRLRSSYHTDVGRMSCFSVECILHGVNSPRVH